MADKEKENTYNEEEFPGYPHYPEKEDIMNQKDSNRVDVDVEDLSRGSKITATGLPDKSVKIDDPVAKRKNTGDMDDDVKIVRGTEADVTKDDLIALGEKDADFGLRENLDVTGDDLDVPGSEEDDADEEIGEEDEENNYYSLGGDAHEDLEEDKG